MPPTGNVCALYTNTPDDLLPYRLEPSPADACACYRACREEYVCDGRVWCPSGANRKDCRDAGPELDLMGGSNPCPTSVLLLRGCSAAAGGALLGHVSSSAMLHAGQPAVSARLPALCSSPGTTELAVPTLDFEVTFEGLSRFNAAMQAAFEKAVAAATQGMLRAPDWTGAEWCVAIFASAQPDASTALPPSQCSHFSNVAQMQTRRASCRPA